MLSTSFRWKTLLAGLGLSCLLAPPGCGAGTARADATQPSRAAAQRILENLPLWFESNEGQMAPEVRYYSRTAGYTLFLTRREAVLTLSPRQAGGTARVLRMSLPGGTRSAEVEGVEPLPARSSYIFGNDPSRWRRDTPHYSRVRYRGVFNGIDLVYRGSGNRLEYDFIVAPGADPRAIRMKFSGAERVYLDNDGALVLSVGGEELRQPKPLVYQQAGGSRVVVPGRYELHRGGEVRFAVGDYDRSQTLVIDPELVYSTYLGGDGISQGAALAVDPAGNLWLAGQVASGAFPTAGDPLQKSRNGSQDIFLAKIDPTKAGGAALVYSTLYGGTGSDTVQDITTDQVGNVYLAGFTSSTDLPLAGENFQATNAGGQDAFVAKFEASGGRNPELSFATYLGGAGIDSANAIAVDASFRIYIAGYTASENYPTTPGAPQPNGRAVGWDAIVSVLDPSKSASQSLIFSTYFGGTSTDVATGIAVDAAGKIYITGNTFSTDYPISDKPPYQAEPRGQGDIFVTKLDPALPGFGAIAYSTYLGGSGYDAASRILLAPSGDIWIAGVTLSKDFPVTPDAAQGSNGGQADAFVARLNINLEASRHITYSSYLGGSGTEMTYGLALDAAGRVYISGYTISADFPVKNSPLQGGFGGGGSDAFLAVLDPRTSGDDGLIYGTYLGGGGTDIAFQVVVDRAGDVSVGGLTRSHSLPLSDNRIQGAFDGFSAAFLTKLKIN